MYHPNLTQFIEEFEREARMKGHYRATLGEMELAFLNQVWGPEFQYNFSGLHAEYPFKDYKGGQRFADFVYVRSGIRLLMEIDGFTTHARNLVPSEFDDHLSRQNDLILSGWLVLRFSANQVQRHPQECKRVIKQAIGHWWSLTHAVVPAKDADVWAFRRQHLVHLAIRHRGNITPKHVASEFDITNEAAVKWLKRYRDEGTFTGNGEGQRVRSYRLSSYQGDE
ncbi:DUF559 domain-containing protein [Paenibacillus koleovorans]|uniref:DUF559 domain-containing protein n=1 Tax=Paenibacillus koleovorans TaxID=121608 RepID=UPI000FDAAC20|nr:DUF559 domain-containing protein [Paenibacillus koleovorans]